jgi:hypothetical protein
MVFGGCEVLLDWRVVRPSDEERSITPDGLSQQPGTKLHATPQSIPEKVGARVITIERRSPSACTMWRFFFLNIVIDPSCRLIGLNP